MSSALAENKTMKLEVLKAAFTFKFTHYIEWPGQNHKHFTIGVLEDQTLYEAIKTIFKDKQIGDKSVEVHFLKTLANSSQLNILHANKIDPALATEIKKLHPRGLLVISQGGNRAAQNAHINFYVDQNERLRFEINKERADLNELKINSRLLNLSRNSR